MTGRPSKLTPEVQNTIVAAVGAGNYKATAAALAGIHRDTLHNWEVRGESGEEPYASFLDALKKAEAESEVAMLAEIRSAQAGVPGVAGADVWTAKAWIMERRWPKRWGGRVRATVSDELGAFVDRLQKRLDEATYRRVLDASREDAPAASAVDERH